MINDIGSIALITPLKDELENIERFFNSLENQSIPIKCLVVVENDSTDGSSEFLDKTMGIGNVERLKVIHLSFEDKTYRVGKKYATIVHEGMEWLRQQDFYETLDFVGILDSDIFPESQYYEKLTNYLGQNPDIGITSGLIFTPEGALHIANPNWVRGGCRLWKRKCLDEAGYLVAYTADTVSVALANLKGWKTKTLKSARVVSREVNVRIANSKNKGYHAYYRGHSSLYVLLKSAHMIIGKKRLKMGREYFMGYMESLLQRKPRIEIPEVRQYFRWYLFNKLIRKYE